jgi:two-component system, OmpR family, phosphate regulon sensor histidine kinase PhoR
MKKKLMKSTLGVLVLSVVILTTLFILIINHQYIENIKRTLTQSNDLVINLIKTDNLKNQKSFFQNNLHNLDIRVTYINKDGNVIFDSEADTETMNNHNDRPEIKDARINGIGYSDRFSVSVKRKMIYVATSFNDGYIIRSSMPVSLIYSFENMYIRYYMITLIFVLILASLVSSRLSQAFVKPIKELQNITSIVAKGELNKRVAIYSKDEIGDLGKAFNNMADKLEYSLKEVTDKQNRLEAILKSMDSGVIAIDKNSRVIMINPYAEEIFGLNKNIIGKNLMDMIRDFELEDIFKHTSYDYNEIKLLWPRERELRIKTADIINSGVLIGKVAVVQDISDIKRLENMRSQFVANVSHELKTPLTSIKGFAETLKYVQDAEKRIKFLDIINDEADRLTRLINDILTLSSLEQHKFEKKEVIDINAIIDDVYNLMKNTAESKNITLSVEGKTLPSIMGDTDKFKQMLINLVDNAIKYSGNNAAVTIGTDSDKNKCILWVKDTGVGMSKEHLSRIFERFYRVDKARSRTEGGTGLGLAIVKHIVLSLNGNIKVESEPSKGTNFIIELPIKIG